MSYFTSMNIIVIIKIKHTDAPVVSSAPNVTLTNALLQETIVFVIY